MDWIAFLLGVATGIGGCVLVVAIIFAVLTFWVHRIDQNDTVF